MTPLAEGDGAGGPGARRRVPETAWRVDWATVPMARLVNAPPPAVQPPSTVPAAQPAERAAPDGRSAVRPAHGERPAPRPPEPRTLSERPVPPPPAPTAPPPPPLPSRRAAPPPPPPPPPARPGRARRPHLSRTTARIAAAIAVLAVTATAAVLLLTRSDPSLAPGAAAGTAPSAEAPAPAIGPTTGLGPRRLYPEDEPFVVGGVRFRVVARPDQQWARDVRSTAPGAGLRWQTISVLFRNVARKRLFAKDLHLRLRAADGSVYRPAPGAGNGGSNLAPGTQIFVGTLVKGRLAFRVPADQGELTLLIDATPKLHIRVALAPG